MMSELPRGARRVIELGGGTGVFTRALLGQGIAPADLLVLELNEELHQHLQRHFPQVHVACADARDLADVARAHGFHGETPADAIVSGLGLLSMPRPTQQAILAFIAERIEADGASPSQVEIAHAFGFKGVRAAQYHLEALEQAGAKAVVDIMIVIGNVVGQRGKYLLSPDTTIDFDSRAEPQDVLSATFEHHELCLVTLTRKPNEVAVARIPANCRQRTKCQHCNKCDGNQYPTWSIRRHNTCICINR